MSVPAPPTITSSPAPALILSLPPPPEMLSAADVPFNVFAPDVPAMAFRLVASRAADEIADVVGGSLVPTMKSELFRSICPAS